MTAATIYMSILGPEGIRRTALQSHQQLHQLVDLLTEIDGVERLFSESVQFHEAVIRVNGDANEVLARLAKRGILGGVALGEYFPDMTECIVLCVTETKVAADLVTYQQALFEVMKEIQA